MRHLPLVLLLAACQPQPPAQFQPLGVGCSRKVGVADHTPEYMRGRATGDRLAEGQVLDLRVVLQLRDLGGLNSFLADMTTAGQPGFGQPMKPSRFADDHLPTAEQAQRAIEALRGHGMQVESAPRGALLHVKATAAQAEAAFGTPVVGGADGGGYRPEGDPTMPDEAIRGVQGLAQHERPRQWTRNFIDAPEPPLTPNKIAEAYNIPYGARGAGQTLAIVGLDGFDQADITAYAQAHGLRQVPIKPVYMGGYDGRILSPEGRLETTLDLELLSAVAPGADAIYAVLADRDDPHGLLDAMNWLANPPPGVPHIKHISCSWGTPESGVSQAAIQVVETVIKQAAVQGQSIFVASGDEGVFDGGKGIIAVDSPASSRWAIAVGGTTLSVGPPREEKTWSGSGGGYSCFWPAPLWQHQAWGRFNQETMRALPDIAFAANPSTPYATWVNGVSATAAGTSAAAPVAAAISALIFENRANKALPPLGYMGPIFYHVSNASDHAFTDIIAGRNSGSGNVGFDAAAGFDAATGLGSIDVSAFMDAANALR